MKVTTTENGGKSGKRSKEVSAPSMISNFGWNRNFFVFYVCLQRDQRIKKDTKEDVDWL